MTRTKKRTEDELKTLFVFWVERLELLHWNFELEIGPDVEKEGSEAWVKTAEDYNWAQIFIDNHWREWKLTRVHKAICHELIHCHLEALYQAALAPMDYLGEPASEMYKERVMHELEHAVDTLANALVHQLENEQED